MDRRPCQRWVTSKDVLCNSHYYPHDGSRRPWRATSWSRFPRQCSCLALRKQVAFSVLLVWIDQTPLYLPKKQKGHFYF
ncbi:expressed unknown protein [Seminavis robusta]|uniref:Uncharacterized protein n=1 Tax=Seminavis robusta TaxID=568900 RepID=A0A9N8DS92_9STRA|nr:expressed unknown protein [Seminavis robusta]|eukprot:Sro243_g097010.1 n/a (79) ;mRNA; f:77771-78103